MRGFDVHFRAVGSTAWLCLGCDLESRKVAWLEAARWAWAGQATGTLAVVRRGEQPEVNDNPTHCRAAIWGRVVAPRARDRSGVQYSEPAGQVQEKVMPISLSRVLRGLPKPGAVEEVPADPCFAPSLVLAPPQKPRGPVIPLSTLPGADGFQGG